MITRSPILAGAAFLTLAVLTPSALRAGGAPSVAPGGAGLAASVAPEPLSGVDIKARLGEQVPLALPFRDEEGRDVALGDYFGKRPVVLALVYYECPMLCTLVLNGLVKALRPLTFEPGKEFEVVVVSFDPGEGPELAASKKKIYLDSYKRPQTAGGWHFLTGSQESIKNLTASVGFSYRYLERTDEYAHSVALMLLTPKGILARYYYGIEYSTRDLKLGIIEASNEKIASTVDKLLLYCFRYDPSTGRYSAVVLNIIRLGGIITVAALVGFVLVMRRRDKRRSKAGS